MNLGSEWRVRSSESKPGRHERIGVIPHSALRIPHSKGFTLLEVMVAVMILGLVLVSLIGLKNRAVEDVMVAEKMTSATLLAKRLMTKTLMTQPLQPVDEEGDFSEEEFKDEFKDEFRDKLVDKLKGFTWKRTIAPTPLPTVLEVRVAVLWKEGSRQEKVELVSYE